MKTKKVVIQYSLLFIAVALVVFFPLILQRKSFVTFGDNYNQFLPTLIYLKQYYSTLFSGNGYAFDPVIGFGEDVIGALSYYGFGDILLFPIFLVSESQIIYAYTIIVILKMWLSGITFIIYCRHKGIKKNMLIAAGIAYAFSFYMLQNGLCIFGFLTAPVYFPLMIMGIDKIYEGKSGKWGLLLAIVVGIQALNGFYFLYDDILGCLEYGVLLLIYKPQSVRNIVRRVTYIILSFCGGVLLASPVLFRAVSYYFQSKRTGETGNIISKLLQLPSLDDILLRIKNMFYPSYGLYEYGFGLSILCLVVFIWLLISVKNKKYNRYLVVFILAIFAYFFPAVGIVMNGFSYNTSRWFYIMFFALIYITVRMIPKVIEDMRISEVIKTHMWPVLLVLNVTIVGFMFFGPVRIGGKGTAASFMSYSEVNNKLYNNNLYEEAQKLASINDESTFYRVDLNDTSLDAPAFMGVNSTYLYYSICNGSIMDIFEKLRVSSAINGTFNFEGLDSRQVLESLFSTKVYTTDYIDVNIKENEFYLPQGLFYDAAVTEEDIENLDYIQKTNLLMGALVVDNTETFCEIKDSEIEDIVGEQYIVNYEVTKCDNATIDEGKIVAQKGGTLTLSFDPIILTESYDELYCQIDNLQSDTESWSDIVIAGRSIRTRPLSEEWYYYDNYDYLVNISSIASEGQLVLEFEHGGTFTFDDIKIIVNNNTNFERLYEERSAYCLNEVKYSKDSIEGYMDEDSDGYLMINLPYSDNWNCYVDGEKVHVLKADWSFMAIYVPKGYHEVKFIYR